MTEALLPSDWPEVTVEDIKADHSSALATGPFGSSISSKYFQESGVPVIRGSNLSEDVEIRLDLRDLVFLAPGKAAEFKRSTVREGDLVFTCWGTIGQVGFVEAGSFPEYVISNKQMKLTPDPKRVDNEFLYYLFSGPEMSDRIRAQMIGSSVPGFNLAQLRRLTLRLPPLNEQVAISHTLGSLDAKIKTNRRMNSVLESLARTLFKSWFVDFDPVRAGHPAFPTSFVFSSLGSIPEGWRHTTLCEAVEIHDSKRIPLSSRQRIERQGIYPYHGAASVMDYVDDYLFNGRFVLMGEDGSVVRENGYPVLQYVWGKFWVNNHAHVLSAKSGISPEHLYIALSEVNVRPYVTGAVQPKLNQGNLLRIPFLLATWAVNEAFGAIVAPLFERLRANTEESRTLAALRDALLPKLLSGEIRVKQAEKIVGEAV